MESSGSHRSGLVNAGGVLTILAGTFETIGGVLVPVFFLRRPSVVWWPMRSRPDLWGRDIGGLALIPQPPSPVWLWTTIVLIILGIIGIGGGVSAIRRRSFDLALAGAICTLLPLVILAWYLVFSGLAGLDWFPFLAMLVCGLVSVSLGVLAVVFVALGKREFGTKVKEDGV